MMKTLLGSAALMFALSSVSFAAVQAQDGVTVVKANTVISSDLEAKRRKPRIPGGSGCDSPRDRREHPECRRGA